MILTIAQRRSLIALVGGLINIASVLTVIALAPLDDLSLTDNWRLCLAVIAGCCWQAAVIITIHILKEHR